MPGTEDREALRKAYDDLRTADDHLLDVELDICAYMTAKSVFFPDTSELSGRARTVRHQAFENWGKHWRLGDRIGIDEDSEPIIDQGLERLNVSRKKYEDIISDLRLTINELSRPYLRGLRIVDMPSEILVKIFEFVEGFNYDLMHLFIDDSTKDIKNCRLTCRLFCSLSSHMLIHLVPVDYRASSVSRLEEISRHPTISKGVRAVQVLLHSYTSDLTTHIEEFIRYHATELEERVDLFESVKMWEFAKVSEEVGLKVVKKARAVLASWRRLTSTATDEDESNEDEDDDVHRVLLDETHKEYRRLYDEQESLKVQGKFSQIVGCAMARMPRARKLEFQDTNYTAVRPRSLILPAKDICGAIYQDMLKPMTGSDAKKHVHEPLPFEAILSIPCAIRSAGAWLSSIDIKLSYLYDSWELVSDPEMGEKLSSAMQRLKDFSFECRDYVNENESDNLEKFLKLCLNTPSLRTLSINMNSDCEDDDAVIGRVGQTITLRPWQNLTNIYLTEIAFDLYDLVLFLKTPQPSLCSLILNDVHLLSGTWAEALDALREKSDLFVCLSNPHGAECDDISKEELAKIFGHRDGRGIGRSQAEQYIHKYKSMENNPLRVINTESYTTSIATA